MNAVRCPVHDELVACERSGMLIGRCWMCKEEAALALVVLLRRKAST